MDLGNLLSTIEDMNYHKDKILIEKYGAVNIESTGNSYGGEYILKAATWIMHFLWSIG